MNDCVEILARVLSKGEVKVTFENLQFNDASQIIESTCYQTLKRIQAVLDSRETSDSICIDRISRLLEDAGIDGGVRIDY